MEGVIIGAMMIGFFAGGNLVIVTKDIENKKTVNPINILGIVAGCAGMLLILATALTGVYSVR